VVKKTGINVEQEPEFPIPFMAVLPQKWARKCY